VGYYTHQKYIGPKEIDLSNIMNLKKIAKNTQRTIITDQPRITYFKIEWKEVDTTGTTKEKMEIE